MLDNETIFIISGILGIWTWLFKVFVIEALQKSIDHLAETISDTVDKMHTLDATVQKHGVMLTNISRRVENLEHDEHHGNNQ